MGAGLQPGEFAHPSANGERPGDGFTVSVPPLFMADLARMPLLVLYQLVLVNYGAFASPEDPETFGASAAGLSRNNYYAALCDLADRLITSGTSGHFRKDNKELIFGKIRNACCGGA